VTLHLFLANSQSIGRGATALATGTVSYVHLAPGRVVNLSRQLGAGLHKGSYRVIATWTDPTGAQHSLEADFTATPARSWLDSLWKFIKDNIALFIGLLVIAVVIVLAWLVRRSRDSQRQTEAELSAARAQLRMARVHGRAAATGERLTARHEREPAPVQTMEPPSPEPEQIQIVQPSEPPRDEAPQVVTTATPNGAATPEPAEPAVVSPPAPPAPPAPPEPPVAAPPPPAATATESDWVPPWERTKPDPPADS
jgi:type II secretory pathway pseudopilin PulG